MKKTKKFSLFIMCGIIVVIVLIYVIYNKLDNKIIIDNNEQCIGTMYYSYMLGIDAGTEYIISLYNSTDSSYKYKITKSDITIKGSVNEKEYDAGVIKTKNDLITLNNQFINKKEKGIELDSSSYRYINRSNEILDFEEFANELFIKK